MSIGAKDRLDELLVEKYAALRVNRIEENKDIPVDRLWQLMNMSADYHKTILETRQVSNKIAEILQKIRIPGKKAESAPVPS